LWNYSLYGWIRRSYQIQRNNSKLSCGACEMSVERKLVALNAAIVIDYAGSRSYKS